MTCTSGAIGKVCSDLTIYAGLSPDGNVPMFAYPCDYGETASGCTAGSSSSTCTCSGTRTTLTWNNGSTAFIQTGIQNTNSGKSDTAALVALSPTTDADAPYYAADACAGLNVDGHTDWYLPAGTELNVLYNNLTAIGHFDTTVVAVYWSSTEWDNDTAIFQSFSAGGGQNPTDKHLSWEVRCVRR